MKYIEKIRKFMYGRYGPDDLYYFLIKLYIFLLIIDLFITSNILNILELLLVFIIFYRFFSKKIYKRNNENKVFLNLKSHTLKPLKKVKKNLNNIKRNIKDEEYIYKKCHNCNTTLRLPLPTNYGVKHVKCPKCNKKLTVLCLKKQKIEIIKKNKRRRKSNV